VNSSNHHSAAQRLRAWWLTPPRRGMARLLWPFEYRHLRFFGFVRVGGGVIAALAGLVCLSYSTYGWGAFFLVIAVLDLAAGYWLLSTAHSESAQK
jgi:hypothetical protein